MGDAHTAAHQFETHMSKKGGTSDNTGGGSGRISSKDDASRETAAVASSASLMKALEDECFGGDETRTVLERCGYRRTKDVDKEYSAFLLIYRRKKRVTIPSTIYTCPPP